MLYADLHTHSIASGHSAPETIQAMAREASKKGLYLLGISDHGPATPGAAKASYFRSLKSAPHIRESVHLYYGTEASILSFQGALDLEDNILSALDYAIVSIHRPFLAPGNIFQNTDAYLSAMGHPQVRIIGHCDDARYETDYERLICAARESRYFLKSITLPFHPCSIGAIPVITCAKSFPSAAGWIIRSSFPATATGSVTSEMFLWLLLF